MTQFIAHTTEPRTFSDKKGATKAIKRDLLKHQETHGDVLADTGFDVKEAIEGRFGVVVYVDLTPSAAQKLVGKELEGYVIEANLPEAAPVKKSDKKEGAPKPAPKKRKSGEVNVQPMKTLIAARSGSKQDQIITLLAAGCVWDQPVFDELTEKLTGYASLVGGCTLEALRRVCVKADGAIWDDNSIRSALYYDVHQKGYGVRTAWEGDVARYSIILPDGVKVVMPARKAKS